MNMPSEYLDALSDLESRQEELLGYLEDLDKRVETVLTECLALRESPEGSSESTEQTGGDVRSSLP